MAQAYGICPVCGKVIALDPVDVPAEPTELLQHLKAHPTLPPAPASAPTPSAEPAPATAPLESFPPLPSVSKGTGPRAHAKGRRPHP